VTQPNLKVGDLVTVKHLWHRGGGVTPACIFKIFSGNQAIVKTESGKRYKVAIGQCGPPLTETQYFLEILKNTS
jgi:hypothetical protein